MSEVTWQAIVVLLVVAVVAEAVVLIGVLREVGSLIMQMGPATYGEVAEGPKPGDDADIELPSDSPTLAMFLGPSCDLCKPVAAALPVVREAYPDLHILPVVVGDDPGAKKSYAASLGPGARTDLDLLYEKWQVPGTPFGVGIGTDGKVITAGVVNSLPQFEMLAVTILEATAKDGERAQSTGHNEAPELVQLGSTRTEGEA